MNNTVSKTVGKGRTLRKPLRNTARAGVRAVAHTPARDSDSERERMGMTIVFDEGKAALAGRSVDAMYADIDRLFAQYDIPKTGRGVYEGRGLPKDYQNCMSVIKVLNKVEWFMNCVGTWIWHVYDSDDDVIASFERFRAKYA